MPIYSMSKAYKTHVSSFRPALSVQELEATKKRNGPYFWCYVYFWIMQVIDLVIYSFSGGRIVYACLGWYLSWPHEI